MNKLLCIFDTITDAKLCQMLEEYRELDETGILKSGVVRELISEVQEEFNMNFSNASSIVSSAVIRKAAYKWHDASKSL